MFEKVNPSHPDKVADRIAGALVDYCYAMQNDPKCAFEVLIGHGKCCVFGECSVDIPKSVIEKIVNRIADTKCKLVINITKQDVHLAENQKDEIRCGDNGVFRGVKTTYEQQVLTNIADSIYDAFPYDGKYVIHDGKIIVCQSNCMSKEDLMKALRNDEWCNVEIEKFNPLGFWTGGINTDTGCTNRKLGTDMGDAVTGSGIQGKDLSKADVTVNLFLHIAANEPERIGLADYEKGDVYTASCAIGDTKVKIETEQNGKTLGIWFDYSTMIEVVRQYIYDIGGFEKLAEWGLIRPNQGE